MSEATKKPVRAGTGNHHVYRIASTTTSDSGKLTAGEHYLGVDAVAWYINKESSWFTDRMASGTLDIKLAGGLESYQAALGTFELAHDAKIAPVFERPVLPDRNYRGGPITLGASLTAIKRDAVVGSMLKSAASASLGIVAGMVDTAAVAGPTRLLTAAGKDLVDGVKRILTDTKEKREVIFDPSGLEFNLQPDQAVGPESFLLMHRGSDLQEDKLSIQPQGRLLLPFYDGAQLEDGAWLLLRLRRADEYSGVREWFEPARKWRGEVQAIVTDSTSGIMPREAAMAQFRQGKDGNATLFDKYSALRAVIYNDGVLTEREAGLRVGELTAALLAARDSIAKADGTSYKAALSNVRLHLSEGRELKGRLGQAFSKEVMKLMAFRSPSLVSTPAPKRVLGQSAEQVFKGMRHMPKTLSELA